MIPLSAIAEIPQALALVGTAVPKIQAALPLIAKTMIDIRRAVADQKDPSALITDLELLIGDITTDFNALASLLPPPEAAK